MKNRIKRLLAVVLTAAVLFSQFAFVSFADEQDGFEYVIISGSSDLRITGYTAADVNVVIPDSIGGRTVAEIGSRSFSGNSRIKSIRISSSVKRIMNEAFGECSALESVDIPASVTSIGDSAFKGCSSLVSVSIHSASTAIGNYAFENCISLRQINIPSSTVGFAAFRNCSALEDITLGSSVNSVGRYAFDGTAWYKNQKTDLVVLNNVVYKYNGVADEVIIPNGMTCIADFAFAQTAVSSVIIPKGMYYIGNQAFYNCRNLTYISLPESIIKIRNSSIGYADGSVVPGFTVYCYNNSEAMSWAVGHELNAVSINNCHHDFSEWKTGENADCTDDGYELRRCKMCNDVETRTLPALGHDWSGWVTISEYSCIQNEVKRKTCLVCGVTEDNIRETTGHVWGEWTVTSEPSCTEYGEHYHICSVCGANEAQLIEPLNHSWTVDDTTDAEGWTITEAPDCTSDGKKLRVCSVCGNVENAVAKALGHKASEWTILKDATAILAGQKQGVCEVCGETFIAEIPPTMTKLPSNVKMFTLKDTSSYVFSDERTCVLGIKADTTVQAVVSQFNYSTHIIAAKIDMDAQDVLPLDDYEKVFTGALIFLMSVGDDGEFIPIDSLVTVVKGDIDGDGRITAADARKALRSSAKIEPLGIAYIYAGDLDGDGRISVAEARKILRVAAKLDEFE